MYIVTSPPSAPVVQALLIHVGEEHAVDAAYINNKLGNPLLLRRYIYNMLAYLYDAANETNVMHIGLCVFIAV